MTTKKHGNTARLFIFAAVAAAIACIMSATSLAAEHTSDAISVRVAYFPMNGYYERDSAGNYAGYGVEYLKAVEQCSDISFEYADAGTWQNAIEMLRSGEADILAPAQRTAERESEFSFLTYPVSYEYGGLLAKESRGDLTYENFEKFNTLTLGCTEDQMFCDDYELYASDNGFAAKEIKYYKDWDSLAAALYSGEVDAIVANMMYNVPPMKVIARFGVSPAYIMVQKGRTDIVSTLENAMNRVNVESPNYLTKLAEKYYPQYRNIPFTQQELEYIASEPEIRVMCNVDEAPFSHSDGQGFHGICISLLERIAELSGLKFAYIPAETRTEMLAGLNSGKGDMLASDAFDFSWARRENVYQTAPYMSAQLMSIGSEQIGVAAMVPGRFATEYVKKNYAGTSILECRSVMECVDAVQSGRADYTIINSYEANYMLSRAPKLLGKEESLYIIQRMCMSVSKSAAPELRSILGKSLGQISEAEIYEFAAQNASQHQEVTLAGLMVRYPVETLAVTSAAIIIFAVLVYIIGMNRVKTKKNRELKAAAEKATQASRAKSDFLSSMSHDIRTPMNAIVNITNLAMEDVHDEERLRSDLDKIKLSSDFLLGLINDILDMSRIESGQFRLEPKIYTAQRFENYIRSVMCPLFAAKDINFILDKNGVRDALYVDEVRFNQIFFNVLSNAAKYTPRGGTVRFFINVLDADESHLKAEFIIADNGIGMSEEFAKKAFEPFEREKSVEAYTGTGLGLAITKAIVDAFGGAISLESAKGRGTTVKITLDLPVPDEKMIGESLQREKLEEIHELSGVVSGLVLVAEDHPLNQEIIKRLLQKQGFSAECVENGALAVEKLKNAPEGTYKLVLMDLRMPVMDGLTATREIRALADGKKAAVPIVAMTADAFAEDRQRCLDAGMDDYLAKPVNVSALMSVIRKLLPDKEVRKKPRVLVADDVDVNIAVIKAALESEFEVLAVSNGADALACLEKNADIAAVITDIQMPGMSGAELIGRIRADRRFDGISILANTQYGDPEQEERLLTIGADDFVYKAATPGVLVARLYNILAGKQKG